MTIRSRSLLGALSASVAWFPPAEASTPLKTLPEVAPAPTRSAGVLIVKSAREEHNAGEVLYYPHTGYALYAGDGHFLQNVRNHIGDWDEDAIPVSLAPGRYFVVVESETLGRVRVPVRIAKDRTTTVNLQRPRR